MGLSIHYSGRLKKKTSLAAMIEEVKDIAEIYKWHYNIYEDQFPVGGFDKTNYTDKIYGISFTPPECETIFLCFLSNGKMSSPSHLQFFGNSADSDEQKYLYMLSVKTQYAGIEIHKLVVHLLKHVSKKYLQRFTVSDEGQYWETGDEELLAEIFQRYTALIESVASGLQNYPMKAGETFENYIERLMKQIHIQNKK